MTNASSTQTPPPQVIFLIRHAEKPVVTNGTTYNGMDVTGTPNPDCLIPQGWQRAGGLARLFDTAVGSMRTDLAVPGQLYSPAYSNPVKTWEHDHIPDIAANIPVVSGAAVPTVWPGDRLDIIWCFSLAAGDGAAYQFTALPELLLSGDGPA